MAVEHRDADLVSATCRSQSRAMMDWPSSLVQVNLLSPKNVSRIVEQAQIRTPPELDAAGKATAQTHKSAPEPSTPNEPGRESWYQIGKEPPFIQYAANGGRAPNSTDAKTCTKGRCMRGMMIMVHNVQDISCRNLPPPRSCHLRGIHRRFGIAHHPLELLNFPRRASQYIEI